jgi:hypothetical protein
MELEAHVNITPFGSKELQHFGQSLHLLAADSPVVLINRSPEPLALTRWARDWNGIRAAHGMKQANLAMRASHVDTRYILEFNESSCFVCDSVSPCEYHVSPFAPSHVSRHADETSALPLPRLS